MARSSFYYHQKTLQKNGKYTEIKVLIKQIYHRHKGRFGYRRITLLLKERGTVINHKTVLRLIDENLRIEKYHKNQKI